MAQPAPAVVTRRLLLTGRVQGVGFRPFVYRLAHELGLDGFVRNLRGDVEVVLHGPAATIERFARDVIDRAPPLARPVLAGQTAVDAPAEPGFHIASSSAALQPQISVPPDFFCCPDCLAELADPGNRRHRYAFINCTQCGPRYTLIEALPYDRPNTTMRAFPLCDACRREYEDPLDRRFHAEPVACPVCGPHLEFVGPDAGNPGEGDDSALAAAVAVLRDGHVLAVKGVGGYHLMCDARSETAVARLRERKHRPDKPLAVMYPWRGPDGLDAVRDEFDPEPAARDALLDPARSIVLLRTGSPAGLAPNIAPGLAEIGVFLPYSPLHQLLLDDFGGPLVATSGNVSGEPVLTSATEAQERLDLVADAFLHHDRPIARPADDSVVRVIAGRARPIRLGRGIAPLELTLPSSRATARAGRRRSPEDDGRAGLGQAHRGLAAYRGHGHAAQRAGVRAGGGGPAAPLRRACRDRRERRTPRLRDDALGTHQWPRARTGAAPPCARVRTGDRTRQDGSACDRFRLGRSRTRRRRHALGRGNLSRHAGTLAACCALATVPPAGWRPRRPRTVAQRGRCLLGAGS